MTIVSTDTAQVSPRSPARTPHTEKVARLLLRVKQRRRERREDLRRRGACWGRRHGWRGVACREEAPSSSEPDTQIAVPDPLLVSTAELRVSVS